MEDIDHTEILFASFDTIAQLAPPGKTVILVNTDLKQRAETLLGSSLEAQTFLKWIEVPEGEACKTLTAYRDVCTALLDCSADRDTVIAAVGGGSTSDLAGFVAHTFMRGLRLIIVPTTLLAMVDASIGGKNAINLGNAKNAIGSFHFPSHMLCDVRWLQTLPSRDISSGMAEVIKHALIDSESHVRMLEELAGSGRPLTDLDEPTLTAMIRRSQEIKLRFIKSDPYDTGIRHALNYGHTFGHAIELVTGLPHGYAVAAGMGTINRFALERGIMNRRTYERVADLLHRFGLPASLEEACALVPMPAPTAEIVSLLAADKKLHSGMIRLVLLHEIGTFSIEPVPLQELAAFAGVHA